MPTRRTTEVPIPPGEINAIRDRVDAHYGAEVWQQGATRILVIRTPAEAPDMVNDVERAVEYLTPDQVDDLDNVVMIGSRRSHVMPTAPFRDLMAQRVAFDKQQCQYIRNTTQSDQWSFRVYKAQGDPRRDARLAVHVPVDNLEALDEDRLDRLASLLGPEAAKGRFEGVACAYLVSRSDEVRLRADHFAKEVQQRWNSHEYERRRKEDEDRQRRIRQAERKRLMEDLARRYPKRERASTRSSDPFRAIDEHLKGHAAERTHALPEGARPDTLSGQHATPRHRADPLDVEVERTQRPVTQHSPPRREEPLFEVDSHVDAPGPQGIRRDGRSRLTDHLEKAGYSVLLDPDVPGHQIQLAAERDDHYPARIIAIFPARLDRATAEEFLASANRLDAELGLIVSDTADADAQGRLVATKVKWLPPTDIPHLNL